MNPREELEQVRRRLGALDYELRQLQLRVTELERVTAPEPATAPATNAAPASPVVAQPAPTRTVGDIAAAAAPSVPSESAEVAGAGELPPILTSVVQPSMTPAVPLERVPSPGARPASRLQALREWLEPLQLWPPLGEENAEVRLAAWWATRLGALLAVIGIVFLGIYVSREAAPWVRFAEVVAVTLGVVGLGVWLERILPRFGAVVFGAGLALAYFSAFGAYAVAPMKVITNPLTAMLGELLVVGGILGVAWRRSSPAVATMAIALGHLTAFLALRSGPAFGPWVVVSLSGVAVFLRIARNWEAPSALAMPLAWLFLLASATGGGIERMSLAAAWVWTAIFYALFVARDGLAVRRGAEMSRIDRALQVTHSSLAVIVGWAVAVRGGAAYLTEYYFVSGGILLVTALVWRKARGAAHLVPVFICKGSGLVALGLIAAFEGQARSLALLAQAFVMLVSAHTSGVRGLRIAALVAGGVALGFYLGERETRPSLALAGSETWLEVIFIFGAGAFAAAVERWLGLSRSVVAAAAVVVGLTGILTVSGWTDAGWSPIHHLVVGAGLWVVAALLRGSLAGGLMAALLALAGHVQLWLYPENRFGVTRLWANEAVLLASAAVVMVALGRRREGSHPREVYGTVVALAAATLVSVSFQALPAAAGLALAAGLSAGLVLVADWAPRWPVAGLSALVLVIGSVFYAFVGQPGPFDAWLGVAALAAWAAPVLVVGSAARWESIHDATWRAWSPAVQTVLATGITVLALQRNLQADALVLGASATALAVFALGWRPGLRPALEASWVLWLVALLNLAGVNVAASGWLVVALSWLPAMADARLMGWNGLRQVPPCWRRHVGAIQATIATLLGLVVAIDAGAGATRLLTCLGLALIAFAAWRWGRVSSARTSMGVLALAGWLWALRLTFTSAIQGWDLGLVAVVSVAVLAGAIPFLIDRDLAARYRKSVRWVGSAAALSLAFQVLLQQKAALAPYATALAGGVAVALFLAGLFGRSRPHRLTGLVGLAICVARVFLVDIDSTLYRIAAFVAVGLVLLWVGFSYHRFRHLVIEDDQKP